MDLSLDNTKVLKCYLTNLQDGREVAKKKAFVPPPRFMNIDEARYSF